MRIYFSGIGGVGIGPLAEISLDAGYDIVGSDTSQSLMTNELGVRGVTISQDQSGDFLRIEHENQPIEWFVYTSALPADHPELVLARKLGIHTAKRDELLAHIIREKNLKLIAIAGTHGKTTTTGMMVWILQHLGVPVSYSVGTTLSWGPSGHFDPKSHYFVYECDEFDRNFLHFSPYLSLITSIEYDHPDTYPTPQEYFGAFSQFAAQSDQIIMWADDGAKITTPKNSWLLGNTEVQDIKLAGAHNRRNGTLVVKGIEYLRQADGEPLAASSDKTSAAQVSPAAHARETWREAVLEEDGSEEVAVKKTLATFPGTNRRFEKLADNLYTDYGHTPTEIAATLQMAHELSDHVVLVYQPHQNIRQHEIRDQYTDAIFADADEVYWLPTYLSREDPNLEILTPEQLTQNLNHEKIHIADLDDNLWTELTRHRDMNHLVLCMGAGTIDRWLRKNESIKKVANVIVLDTSGNFIFQQRDDKPEIFNPGMVTGFGGAVEGNESVREGAARELHEETNLTFSPTQLEYFTDIFQPEVNDGKPRWVSYFILRNQSAAGLEIYEGQGYVLASPNDLDSLNLSPTVRQALEMLSNRS